jgi:hypothetical protein
MDTENTNFHRPRAKTHAPSRAPNTALKQFISVFSLLQAHPSMDSVSRFLLRQPKMRTRLISCSSPFALFPCSMLQVIGRNSCSSVGISSDTVGWMCIARLTVVYGTLAYMMSSSE